MISEHQSGVSREPSGRFLDWGNTDFDVNLMISDAATDQEGQLFFDIFDTEGFLGDLPMVKHLIDFIEQSQRGITR